MKPALVVMLVILGLDGLAGCTPNRATIAQIHLDNTVTSYHDTPNELGLLTVAEREAEATLEFARLANEKTTLAGMKRHIRSGMHTVDPGHVDATGGLGYGVRRATSTAIDQLRYAKNSKDARDTLRESVGRIVKRAEEIVKRSNLMLAVGDEVLASANREEARLFAQEFQHLAEVNLFGGPDDSPQAYGLRQFRSDVDALIEGEYMPRALSRQRVRLVDNYLVPRSPSDYGQQVIK